MKKKLSRMLALLCTLALALTMVSIPALAETDTDAPTSGVDDNISWKIEGNTLTISGKGEMKDDYELRLEERPWEAYAKTIQTVVIEDGITGIGDAAFASFVNLTDVKIPKSVTRIGRFAFSNCRNMTEFTIPKNVTEMGGGAFLFCPKLEKLTIAEGNKFFAITTDKKSLLSTDGTVLYCSLFPAWTEKIYKVPSGVKQIKRGALSSGLSYGHRTKLDTIVIPSSIKEIELLAFSGAEPLRIVFEGTEVPILHLNEEAYGHWSFTSSCFGDEGRLVYFPEKASAPYREALKNETNLTLCSYEENEKEAILLKTAKRLIYGVKLDENSYRDIDSYKSGGGRYTLVEENETIKIRALSETAYYQERIEDLKELLGENLDEYVGWVDRKGNFYEFGEETQLVKDSDVGYWCVLCPTKERGSKPIIPVTELTLDRSEASVEVGKTLTLTATVKPNNASDKTVIWKSSDESVATVDAAGVVTAKKAGTADIIVTTKDGNLTLSCKVTVTAEHVHNYSKEEVTKEPTCTEKGEKKLTCSCGESKTEEIPALGHKTEVQGKKEATCGADGYTGDTVCTVCKEVIEKGETIPKTGKHTYTSEVTKEPTCTEKGEKTSTCSVCGDIQKEDIDALGHNYMPEVTKEPTVDEKGERTYTCTRCEDSYTEEIPVLPDADHEHNYKEEVTTEPTCTKSGVKTFTCDGCTDSYTEPVDALGHNYESEVTKPATVDEEGVRTYTCTRCDDTYTEAIPKLTKPSTGGNSGSTGTPGIGGGSSVAPSEPTEPTTPGTPSAAELAKENWTASNGKFTHKDADGKNSTGSRWIESNGVGHRYIFGTDGVLQTGKASAAGTVVTAAGEILMNGNLYYLNPDRNVNDPRTCYVMTDYLQIRDNYAGQTYFDKDGITFQGWMKTPEGGLRYQTRIARPGQPTDLYLIVWRVQDLPACQHPDHPGDPAYNLPAGRYFFDDEGVLVQKEGWNDGKDGKEYYTNAKGMVIQERAK